MTGPNVGNPVRRPPATPSAHVSPDQELLARFLLHHDENAFAALVERHGAMVLGVCERVLRNSHDAEDACQATFLVLARKATSVRKLESLASWLHGVAWRVARRLKTSLARRDVHEKAAAVPKPTLTEPADLSWREVSRLIDEELNRLPETSKAPLVLCYFEGRTQDEAARELGWSLGALRGRLERGREKLRARLVRRGITASAAVALPALIPALGSAAVPPPLVLAASKASLAMAKGTALPADIPANVVSLAHEYLRGSLLPKMILAFSCGLAVVVASLAVALQPGADLQVEPPQPKTVDIWTEGRALEGEKAHAWCVAFSPDGKLVASGWGGTIPTNGFLTLWDAGTGEKLYALKTTSSVRGVAFAPDGKTLATAEHDGRARLRDVLTGAVLFTCEGHKSGIDTVSFAPDGKTLATSSWDKTVKLWDTATGEHLRTFAAHKNTVFAAALGKGDLAASACVDGTAMIWQASTGQLLFTLRGHRNVVHWLAFAPDGKTLATASWDKTVKLWDTASGKETASLYGHTEKVLAVSFSPDGALLASCSGKWAEKGMNAEVPAPAEVIVWNLSSKKKRTLTPHDDRVFGVAFSPDGVLATASWDGAVKLWKPATAIQTADEIPPMPPKQPSAVGKKKKSPNAAKLPPRRDYPQEFYHTLKGDAVSKSDMTHYGPDADQWVKFEPAGLRITLPIGYPGQRPNTGLATEFGVKGDFEITVNFEILQGPTANDPGQRTEFVLLVTPKEPSAPDVWLKANQNRASLSRQAEDRDNLHRFLFTTTKWNEAGDPNKKEMVTVNSVPTGAMTGRLRLVRAGSLLYFFAAEDLSDDFTLLHTAEFGVNDLKSVRIVAATGDPSAPFDVRASELRIRAEALLRDEIPRETPIAQPAKESKLLLYIALLGLAPLIVVGLVLVFLLIRRARAQAQSTGPQPQLTDPVTPPLVVQCACGKKLKVKSELAGRKIKCPQCGKAIDTREA